jgi:hypothetical protein
MKKSEVLKSNYLNKNPKMNRRQRSYSTYSGSMIEQGMLYNDPIIQMTQSMQSSSSRNYHLNMNRLTHNSKSMHTKNQNEFEKLTETQIRI